MNVEFKRMNSMNSFLHSVTLSILIDHLLHAKHCSRGWGYPRALSSLWVESRESGNLNFVNDGDDGPVSTTGNRTHKYM